MSMRKGREPAIFIRGAVYGETSAVPGRGSDGIRFSFKILEEIHASNQLTS